MDEIKHKSHIGAIEGMFGVYPNLINFLANSEGRGYEEWTEYLSWINSQKLILQECLKKLRENYSYASIFPVIRETYENFWFIDLAMNGVKHYKYFYAKKGHDINKIYKKWVRDLEAARKKGDLKDVLEIYRTKKRIKITYLGFRIRFNGKETNEFIPLYYFLFKEYNPIEAYVGKQRKIIDKYLIPPHLFNRFILQNKNLKEYFDFQNGIIPHLILNKLITKKQKQRIIIHYNFLSLWVHPNKIAFRETGSNFDFKGNKNENRYIDRLTLLYIGHLTKMLLTCFLDFLKRQQKERKISKPNKIKLKEVTKVISNFENTTSYFWFIYNKPSKFYKYDYAINKIWRKSMFQKNITRVSLAQIKDGDVPYYNNPLESLRRMCRGWTNVSLGQYIPEIKWE